jgi:hypothetical protein
LAGAVSALEEAGVLEDFLLLLLWWCFLWWLEPEDLPELLAGLEAAGLEAAGAEVDWAKAGPAISAAATTGTRCFNIDVISREEKVCALLACTLPKTGQRARKRRYYH